MRQAASQGKSQGTKTLRERNHIIASGIQNEATFIGRK